MTSEDRDRSEEIRPRKNRQPIWSARFEHTPQLKSSSLFEPI